MKRILFFHILLINFTWSNAQVTKNFHSFSVNEGLPSSQIYSMTEDSYGYLWFFTDHGISRYDGYKFENFNKNDGLCDDVVFNYYKTENEIWIIGQNRAITIISGKTPTFTAYDYNDTIQKYGKYNPLGLYINTKKELIINFGYSLENLTISSLGKVLEKPAYKTLKNNKSTLDKDTKVCIHIYEESFFKQSECLVKKQSSKPYNFNRKFTKIKGAFINDNSYAFIKGDSTIEFNSNNNSKQIYHPDNALNIGTIQESSYWISFIGNGIKFYNVNGEEKSHLLINKTVTNFHIDKEKNYWFSTLNNGAFMLASNQFNIIKSLPKSNNISDLQISNNQLYVGYKTGSVYKLENKKLNTIYTAKKSKPISFATNTEKNTLLFVADRTLLEYDNNISPIITNLDYPYQLKTIDNKLGFSGFFGYRTIKNDQLSKKIQLNKTYDFTKYNNQLYLGTYTGLYRIINPKEKINLLDKRINRLAIINDLLFVGTHGDGLYIFNDTVLTLKIEGDELNGGYISSIKQQNETTIWVGTNTGICKIEFTDTTNIFKYNITDLSNSIPEKEISDIEILNDTIWVGTNNGLYFNSLKQEESLNNAVIPYFLKIKQIKVNDEIQSFDSLLVLDHNENRLTINYTGIRFKQNHSITYRYKLIGLEDQWNYTEKQSVTYASIPPGKYKFLVQIKEENNTWEIEQKDIIIIINKPFWKTEWFITSVICGLLILIYLFFKYRILLYNKDIVRELLRYFLRTIKRNEKSIIVKISGAEVKIITSDILYVKSDGNYLEIHTHSQKYVTREKISNFMKLVPDQIEFMQIRRSHIVRLDKITGKGKKQIMINEIKIQVGETYLEKLNLINI